MPLARAVQEECSGEEDIMDHLIVAALVVALDQGANIW